MVDIAAAEHFAARHARPLDRARLGLLLGRTGPAQVLRALTAYRNDDGGYGWALEPDVRTYESQPAAALHAFEAFEEALPATSPDAVGLCDWLADVSLGDGALPFTRPLERPDWCAPWWRAADPTRPSLHMTACVAAAAHRLGRGDAAVRDHPWLAAAVEYCLTAVERDDGIDDAIELRFTLDLLDEVTDTTPRAAPLLERLAGRLPASGTLSVAGGTADEAMHPLDFAPTPRSRVRRYLADDIVEADLARIAAGQQHDGGWSFDWAEAAPAAGLDWRGWCTVRALRLLKANDRL
jgi:hypothetical protein